MSDSHFPPDNDVSLGYSCTRAVKYLLLANVGAFLLQMLLADAFTQLFWLDGRSVREGFQLWRLVTYMFLHDPRTLWHIIFNMLALWLFGSEVERAMGARRFLAMYFTAGLVGAVLCCIWYTQPTLGASGAILAILVAFAMFFPHATVILFIFPMKARWLAIIFVGITIWQCLVHLPRLGAGQDSVAHWAHLGGIACGYLFVRYGSLLTRLHAGWQTRKRQREFVEEDRMREKVDELLEKVRHEGLPSLSRRERAFLTDASKRYREGSTGPFSRESPFDRD